MEKVNFEVELQENSGIAPTLVGAGCGILCLGALCASGIIC